jgi:hypothetical protein
LILTTRFMLGFLMTEFYLTDLISKKNIDFNEIPEINGVPVNEFNIDTLEDKPWKKPGKVDFFSGFLTPCHITGQLDVF